MYYSAEVLAEALKKALKILTPEEEKNIKQIIIIPDKVINIVTKNKK